MKPIKLFIHVLFVAAALLAMAVMPVSRHFDIFNSSGGTDAKSSATLELPDKPSGQFVVIINTQRHIDTAEDWKSFFSGEDFPVIFDDINCLAAEGDTGGIDLAERYVIQLPENQMTLRTENAELLASKTEAGYIDSAVFSSEMAEHLGLDPENEDLMVIKVSGGEN